MSYIQIKSSNENLSHVLSKNPASGMMARSIRKGNAFGWFNKGTYNVFFKDSDIDVSYKAHEDEQFEYVNQTRYNSAIAVLNMISTFFGTTVKKRHEMDTDGHIHGFIINMLKVPSDKIFDVAEKTAGFDLTKEELSKDNYRITITTKKSIQELLNFINIFCLYAASKNNRDNLDIKDELIEKYMQSLNMVDPPYIIRYMFKLHALRQRQKFDKYKELLQTTENYDDIKLTFGNTCLARRDWVKRELGTLERDIVDVGCGEGFYVLDLARKLDKIDKTYYAVDIDEECRDTVEGKVRKKQIENVQVLEDVSNVDLADKDVLLIEVMEHMPYDNAVKLVKNILSEKPNKLLITTPNAAFNRHYFNSGLRHDDHNFELKEAGFLNFLDKVTPEGYTSRAMNVGDEVDGCATTQGAVIEKSNE